MLKHKKILYILNIAKRINNFSYTSMLASQSLGMEFHIAGNWSYETDEERKADEKKYNVKIHQIDFIRAPYHPGNRKAYSQLKELVKREKYDVIHCNTPIGGVLGRLVGKQCKVDKIIYQAHGFHFYKGAPLLNRTVFKWIEQILAHCTDSIITMNQEDYEFAKTLNLGKGGKTYFGHGVGVNTEEYFSFDVDQQVKRKELGLKNDDIVLLSMGDLIPRKNYPIAIKAIAEAKNNKVQYLICGLGSELNNLKALANELGVEKQIHFLGFRTDIKELSKTADIFLFTSKQEGLPRSTMEAMACGLPCIVSNIRGNVDLIEDGVNGYLCSTDDYISFANAINKISMDAKLRNEMSKANIEKIKEYDVSVVIDEMIKIYCDILS